MLRERVVARHRLRNAAVEAADIALVLTVDSSGSISDADLALQFQGYAEAITSGVFMNAVRSAGTAELPLPASPGQAPAGRISLCLGR
jgi:hypothetical protein